MSETIPEVIAAMRAKYETMRPGGVRNSLMGWLHRLEAALDASQGEFVGVHVHPEGETPIYSPKPPEALRTGIFDNRKTNQREKWENGRLGPVRPADWCPPSHPFGTYPDVEGL
jgi:hypothetical protein